VSRAVREPQYINLMMLEQTKSALYLSPTYHFYAAYWKMSAGDFYSQDGKNPDGAQGLSNSFFHWGGQAFRENSAITDLQASAWPIMIFGTSYLRFYDFE
jgi:hypothetical protein